MSSSEASVLSKVIPGFGGYASEQRRRDDDLAVRRYLVDRLQESKTSLQSVAVRLVDKALFGPMRESEDLRQQIDKLQSKLRAAVEGYSSWFESNRVDEKKLAQVLELDDSLIGFVDKLDSDLKSLDREQPNFSDALATVQRIQERFIRRNEILAK